MNTALPSIPLVFVLAGCSASDGDADIETDAATSTGVAASTTSSTDPVDSSSSATTLTSGSSDDSSSTTANDSGEDASSTGPAATCDTIADVLPLATTCRVEASRCTLSLPASTRCAAACEQIGQTCLRAYPASDTCEAAVYEDALACEQEIDAASFCQCGDPDLKYPPLQIVTIGDSTMDNGSRGEAGWGNMFPPLGVRPEDLHNWGSSGASSLDFEQRSNWPSAQALLGPDVYLFIQFGHNDASDDPNRHTEPGEPPDYEGTYRERLRFYADAARDVGATPVILTSLGRMLFNEDGTTRASHGNYPPSARQFAADEGLIMLDANRASRGEYERLGQEQTLALYSYDEPTHFTPEGAMRMAELTVRLACIESEALCAQFVPLD
ncbi:MAG: GDSL-type esterase/lipase family protein [Nannocystaceae bacterium]|nr:GDSL-type esterase/lipase family protein [bacterium]